MAEQDFNIRIRTTADTSGIRQTQIALDNLTKEQKEYLDQVGRRAYEAGRAIRVALGGAAIAGGYKFITEINSAAAAIEKISKEIDKQGEQLIRNVQSTAELAKFATTNSDVLKVGEQALKGVEASHKKLLDSAAQELSLWEKAADVWASGFRAEGPIAAAKRLAFEQAQQSYAMERQAAIHDIIAAQRDADALAVKDYTQQVEFLTDKIKEQEATQRRVGVQHIEDYLKAGVAAENYRKILNGIVHEHEREAAAADKSAQKNQAAAESFAKGAVTSADINVQAALRNEAEARRTGDPLFQKAAEQYKRGFSQQQREEYEGLSSNKDVIQAINDLRRDLIGIWR